MIFGLLNIINFAHGAQYMIGAFCAWIGLNWLGLNYWMALVIAPIVVGAGGILIKRFLLRRIQQLDHVYRLLLTFGVALLLEGAFREFFGSTGLPYAIPEQLQGRQNLGAKLPRLGDRRFAPGLLRCLARDRKDQAPFLFARCHGKPVAGASVRRAGAAHDDAHLRIWRSLGRTRGVMAAPIYQLSPLMGSRTIIVVFAVVGIGGMGSIAGAIISGFALGLAEGLAKVFYPQASSTVIFVIMALVLLVKPAGLFGRPA